MYAIRSYYGYVGPSPDEQIDELENVPAYVRKKLQLDQTKPSESEEVRITSYNVCYTKLLRSGLYHPVEDGRDYRCRDL